RSPPAPPLHRSTLSLHDALPILALPPRFPFLYYSMGIPAGQAGRQSPRPCGTGAVSSAFAAGSVRVIVAAAHRVFGDDGVFLLRDRKSTRLNSSHVSISYAVFCL